METCKRKKIEIPGWVLPWGMVIAILLIIGSYYLGYYLYSPAKKPANEVATKNEAVAADKETYTITELVPKRLYLIKSLEKGGTFKLHVDATDEFAQGLQELSEKFKVIPINTTAINKYQETGSKTVALVVSTEPESYFGELLKKDMEPPK